jgi:hypothetical protein
MRRLYFWGGDFIEMKQELHMVRQIVEFKSALVVVSVLMGGIVFGQSIEQRQKADEYKCSFSCKMIGQSGKENKKNTHGTRRSKTRGISYQYSLRLNSKTQEVFTVETYFMASGNRDVFAFAKDEFDVELRRGFSTNVVVSSPLLMSEEYGRRNYGAKVVGVIGRLKKDGVIVKTHCSMSPWKKMAWQDEIEIKDITYINGKKK